MTRSNHPMFCSWPRTLESSQERAAPKVGCRTWHDAPRCVGKNRRIGKHEYFLPVLALKVLFDTIIIFFAGEFNISKSCCRDFRHKTVSSRSGVEPASTQGWNHDVQEGRSCLEACDWKPEEFFLFPSVILCIIIVPVVLTFPLIFEEHYFVLNMVCFLRGLVSVFFGDLSSHL